MRTSIQLFSTPDWMVWNYYQIYDNKSKLIRQKHRKKKQETKYLWKCFILTFIQLNLHKMYLHTLRLWQCTHTLSCAVFAGHTVHIMNSMDILMPTEWLSIFACVYIYPWWQVGMCERWEVRNPTRRQIHTGRHTHTSPHTWTEIFTHHTQTTAPRLSESPLLPCIHPHQSAPRCVLYKKFERYQNLVAFIHVEKSKGININKDDSAGSEIDVYTLNMGEQFNKQVINWSLDALSSSKCLLIHSIFTSCMGGQL